MVDSLCKECPEFDTLAAWVQVPDSPETSSWTDHIYSCAYCADDVALLTKSQEIAWYHDEHFRKVAAACLLPVIGAALISYALWPRDSSSPSRQDSSSTAAETDSEEKRRRPITDLLSEETLSFAELIHPDEWTEEEIIAHFRRPVYQAIPNDHMAALFDRCRREGIAEIIPMAIGFAGPFSGEPEPFRLAAREYLAKYSVPELVNAMEVYRPLTPLFLQRDRNPRSTRSSFEHMELLVETYLNAARPAELDQVIWSHDGEQQGDDQESDGQEAEEGKKSGQAGSGREG